jgi:hypothetical protein
MHGSKYWFIAWVLSYSGGPLVNTRTGTIPNHSSSSFENIGTLLSITPGLPMP